MAKPCSQMIFKVNPVSYKEDTQENSRRTQVAHPSESNTNIIKRKCCFQILFLLRDLPTQESPRCFVKNASILVHPI